MCDDERQLRVGTQHRLFSCQCELWRPEGARAYISRPFAPINPSLKGSTAETPNTAQRDAGGLKQMELKGSGASVAAAWIYHAGGAAPSRMLPWRYTALLPAPNSSCDDPLDWNSLSDLNRSLEARGRSPNGFGEKVVASEGGGVGGGASCNQNETHRCIFY